MKSLMSWPPRTTDMYPPSHHTASKKRRRCTQALWNNYAQMLLLFFVLAPLRILFRRISSGSKVRRGGSVYSSPISKGKGEARQADRQTEERKGRQKAHSTPYHLPYHLPSPLPPGPATSSFSSPSSPGRKISCPLPFLTQKAATQPTQATSATIHQPIPTTPLSSQVPYQ